GGGWGLPGGPRPPAPAAAPPAGAPPARAYSSHRFRATGGDAGVDSMSARSPIQFSPRFHASRENAGHVAARKLTRAVPDPPSVAVGGRWRGPAAACRRSVAG